MGKPPSSPVALSTILIVLLISSTFLMTCTNLASAEPTIQISPAEGEAGTMARVDGSGFVPLSFVTITFDGGNIDTLPPTIQANALGEFSATFEVPHSIGKGSYKVVARGHGVLTVSASTNFEVTVPNNPPVADSQSFNIAPKKEVEIVLKGSDPDGDAITFSIVDQPQHGTINGFETTSGSLTFVSVADYEGNDRFTFKVNDGQQDSFLAEVSIRILGSDSGPTMEDMEVQVMEDTKSDILLRATDEDSASLTFQIVDTPTHGSLDYVRPYDGRSAYVSYTPHSNFNGTDSFTAKARDTRFESEIATVTVVVLPVQDRPTAIGGQISTTEDRSIEITLTASDPDGDTLVYSLESLPSHGTLVGSAPNLRYLPSEYRGWDSFTFKVNDGTVDSNTARIQIKVEVPSESKNNDVGSGSNPDSSSAPAKPTRDVSEEVIPATSPPPIVEQELPQVVEAPSISQPAVIPEAVKSTIIDSLGNDGPDTLAPRLVFPASTLVFDSQSEAGTSVTYNIAAIDDVDGEINPECSPNSGSRFPVGKVNVVCTATDSAGNTVLGSFEIEVRLLANEKEKIDTLNLDFLQILDQLPIPDLHFAVIPLIIAGAAGTALAIGVKVSKKTKTKKSEPPQSSS
jgi:hypothetical protein